MCQVDTVAPAIEEQQEGSKPDVRLASCSARRWAESGEGHCFYLDKNGLCKLELTAGQHCCAS